MSIKYYDAHSHIYMTEYDADRDAVLVRMKEKSVGTISIGTNLETSKQAVESCSWGEGIYAAVGFHPTEITEASRVEDLREFLKDPKVVAIGECGMDFFRMAPEHAVTEKALQQRIFEEQIDLAVEAGKPLMIHCRQAYPEVLEILASKKKVYGDKLRANFHFFTEPIETAKKILELGFTMSFTGVITFAPQYRDLVAFVPLQSMLVETDAPFASPIPYRGTRNEPVYVLEIIRAIGEIKGLSFEEISAILLDNTKKVFGVA